ncbi:uncharacterized protein [Amphiura filiformis]|uniref:uncharacterized protein n=1 Tax=Amphiura filiformis TaxID=82378 RepID=UPI003B213241
MYHQSTSTSRANYTIHGHNLEVVNSAKYLGVSLDSRLSFNTHIDTITKKANCTRAFFSRNLSHGSHKVKEAVYNTFIRPTVEYAATSWDSHTQRNTSKLEQVQRSSARYVMSDYSKYSSVSTMLKHLGWTSLQERRLQSRLHMMYKISNNLVDIPWNHYCTCLNLYRPPEATVPTLQRMPARSSLAPSGSGTAYQ